MLDNITFRGIEFEHTDLGGGCDAWVANGGSTGGYWVIQRPDRPEIAERGDAAVFAYWASQQAFAEAERPIMREVIAEFCADGDSLLPHEGVNAKYLETYWGEIFANPYGSLIDVTDASGESFVQIQITMGKHVRDTDAGNEYLRNLTDHIRRQILAKDNTINNMDVEGN